MPRDLDYAPLQRRVPLRDRWRECRAHGQLTYGVVVGGLVLLAPLVVVAVLAARGTLGDDGGLLVFLAFLAGCGLWALGALAMMAGDGAALRHFARVNRLETVPPGFAPHYAGGVFARESHLVYSGVRTPEDPGQGGFVEVGERFAAVGSRSELEKNLGVYLRVRLSGPSPVACSGDELLTSRERLRLMQWARLEEAGLTVEVSGDELTVLGQGRLKPRRAGRLQEGFELAEVLRARGEEVFVPRGRAEAAAERRTTSGVRLPEWERPAAPAPTRPHHPLVVAAVLLGAVAGVSVAVALVMSALEGFAPRSAVVGYLALAVILPAVFAVVAVVFRWLMRGRRA